MCGDRGLSTTAINSKTRHTDSSHPQLHHFNHFLSIRLTVEYQSVTSQLVMNFTTFINKANYYLLLLKVSGHEDALCFNVIAGGRQIGIVQLHATSTCLDVCMCASAHINDCLQATRRDHQRRPLTEMCRATKKETSSAQGSCRLHQ